MNPIFSIIILNYNSTIILKNCLESIENLKMMADKIESEIQAIEDNKEIENGVKKEKIDFFKRRKERLLKVIANKNGESKS